MIPHNDVHHEIQEMYECFVEERRKTNIGHKSKSLEVYGEANKKKNKFGKVIHIFPFDKGGLFISIHKQHPGNPK